MKTWRGIVMGRNGGSRHWPRRRKTAAALTLTGLALGLAFWLMLPDTLFRAPLSYVVEARDGTLLSARIAADGQWRFPPGRQVPRLNWSVS